MAKSTISKADEKAVRDHDKFMLRMPDGMREAISEKAAQNGRSMNGEIVSRLEWTFQIEQRQASDGIEVTTELLAGELRDAADSMKKVSRDNFMLTRLILELVVGNEGSVPTKGSLDAARELLKRLPGLSDLTPGEGNERILE